MFLNMLCDIAFIVHRLGNGCPNMFLNHEIMFVSVIS